MGTSWLIAAKWTLFTVALILFLFRDGNCQNVMQHNNNDLVRVPSFTRNSRGNNKVCGNELTNLLADVCKNYIVKEQKRRFSRQVHPKLKVFYDPVDFEDYDEMNKNVIYDNVMSDPSIDYQRTFLKKIYGGTMVPSWKNGKRFSSERQSVIQECCYKSCSYSEMLGYCDGKGGYRAMSD